MSIIVDEDIHQRIGTGFYFIQRQFFVTAKHVVEYGSHCSVRAGTVRKNLVVMQASADGSYPKARVWYRHPTIDIAVLRIERPGCKTPLYPSNQRLAGAHGLRYWGYFPKSSNPSIHLYGVRVVGPAKYVEDDPSVRDNGEERRLLFEDMPYEPGHSGGPVLGIGGGVVALITQGDTDGKWFRATEIGALLPFLRFVFPRKRP